MVPFTLQYRLSHRIYYGQFAALMLLVMFPASATRSNGSNQSAGTDGVIPHSRFTGRCS